MIAAPRRAGVIRTVRERADFDLRGEDLVPGPGDVIAAVTTVRAHGLRVSAARRRVLEALFAADGPVTAEQLAGGLGGRMPRLDLASVYRNLAALEQIGVVDRVALGHGASVFGVRGHRPPAVAVCERCGARSAIDGQTLEHLRSLVRGACGLSQAFAHGAVVGLCEPCAARAGRTASRHETPRP